MRSIFEVFGIGFYISGFQRDCSLSSLFRYYSVVVVVTTSM